MNLPAVLLASLIGCCAGGPAWPHATLLDSVPPDGAMLAQAPASLVLRFDEAVAPIDVRLVGAQGESIGLPVTVQARDGRVTVTLPPGLGEGTYVVGYRVASADAHPVSGSVQFTVGDAPPPVKAVAAVAPPRLSLVAVVLRGLRDAAILLAAGLGLYAACVGTGPRQRYLLPALAGAAAVLGVLVAAQQGAVLVGDQGPLGVAAWRAGLASSAGVSAALAMIAAGLLAWAGSWPAGAARRGVLIATALALAGSLALSGHAAGSRHGLAGSALIAAHAGAAAYWAGALLALLLSGRRQTAAIVAALRRFAAVAPAAVVVLLAAGVGFAAMQLDTWRALGDTDYGRLVLAKAGLLMVLLGVAARNRLVLMPRIESGTAGALDGLRGAIVLELALIAAVVAVTALLSQTPARVSAPVIHDTVIQRILGSGVHRLELKLTPGRVGRNTIEAMLTDRDGRAFDAASITLELSHSATAGMPLRRDLERAAPGRYVHEGRELAFAGAWQVTIHVRIDDFDVRTLNTTVDLRASSP